MAQKYCVLFLFLQYIRFEVLIMASLASCSLNSMKTFCQFPHRLYQKQEIGLSHLPIQITPQWLLKGPLLKKKPGLQKEGVLGWISDVWIGACQRVGSYYVFCLFYIIYILFIKQPWPNVLDQSPFCLNLGQSASTGNFMENPSRFSPLFCHSRRLSKAHGGTSPGDPVVKTSPQNQRMRV